MKLKFIDRDGHDIFEVRYYTLENKISRRMRVLIASLCNESNYVVSTSVRADAQGIQFLEVKATSTTTKKNINEIVGKLNRVLL